MSVLSCAVDEYLALRRTLGFKLTGVGRVLQQFVRFAESEGAEWVTTDVALRWATQPTKASPAHWARRLGIVRQFAQYFSAVDPRTEVPPPLLPHHYVRQPPYLYRDEEVTALIEAAACLPSPTGLRAATYATLLGLLAVTGMRISEPVGLDRADVDLSQGSLSIRGAKFGKSRWLPLSDHNRQACPLCRAARRSLSHTVDTELFSLRAGDAAHDVECAPHLRHLVPPDRLAGAARSSRTTAA